MIRNLSQSVDLLCAETRRKSIDRMDKILALMQTALCQIRLKCRRHGELIGCETQADGRCRQLDTIETHAHERQESMRSAIGDGQADVERRAARIAMREGDRKCLYAGVARAQKAGELVQHA